MKLFRTICLIGCVACAYSLSAQTDTSTTAADSASAHFIDSISHKVKQRIFSPAEADSLVRQIEHLHITLHAITNQATFNEQIAKIQKALPAMDSNLSVIKEYLPYYKETHQLKNLQMFKVLLADMRQKLGLWKDT